MTTDSRYGWLGGERCQDCGKRYRMPWHAPDEVWEKVMGSEGGMLCPECFDRLAACRGYDLYWSCAIGNFPGDIPIVLLKQMQETEMADVRWKKAEAEVERLHNACVKMNEEICQIAGQALGYYPWFKDDQKNFPGATEAHGVCVGDHVAESITQELADRFRLAEEAIDAYSPKEQK